MIKIRFIIFKMIVLVSFFLTCSLTQVFAENAYIQIKCEPGVKIYLDNNYKGITGEKVGGLIIQNIKPGKHILKVSKTGFQTQIINIHLSPGQIYVHKVGTFSPRVKIEENGGTEDTTIKAATGTLHIKSVPVECKIQFSSAGLPGYSKKKAEMTVKNVPVGKHTGFFIGAGKKLPYTINIRKNKTSEVMVNFLTSEIKDNEDKLKFYEWRKKIKSKLEQANIWIWLPDKKRFFIQDYRSKRTYLGEYPKDSLKYVFNSSDIAVLPKGDDVYYGIFRGSDSGLYIYNLNTNKSKKIISGDVAGPCLGEQKDRIYFDIWHGNARGSSYVLFHGENKPARAGSYYKYYYQNDSYGNRDLRWKLRARGK